jgi:hypothetical protein
MIMARARIKTEMTGTGGSRRTTRHKAKTGARKLRRANDKAACADDNGDDDGSAA